MQERVSSEIARDWIAKTDPAPGTKRSVFRDALRDLLDCRKERDEPRAALRDRDELWCRAIAQSLDPPEMEAVTRAFNVIRPDAANMAAMVADRACIDGGGDE